MKYAFPGTEGVMVVSHQQGYSAVGLYHPARGVPNRSGPIAQASAVLGDVKRRSDGRGYKSLACN